MIEVSKSKISGLIPQKMIILWTLKHLSAISEHPVYESLGSVLPTIDSKLRCYHKTVISLIRGEEDGLQIYSYKFGHSLVGNFIITSYNS